MILAALSACRHVRQVVWSSLTWSQMRKMAPRLEVTFLTEKVDLNKIYNNPSVLVNELVCVSVHPVLWRKGHFIEVAAVITAFT